jgi:hypothetical protein
MDDLDSSSRISNFAKLVKDAGAGVPPFENPAPETWG